MREINLSADQLVRILLDLENERNLCLLDSCGVSHLASHRLIAGINPLEILEINEVSAEKTLALLNAEIERENLAAILTISYDFGLKLNKINSRRQLLNAAEPDVFLALFDVLIVHDYDLQKTFLRGDSAKFDEIEKLLAGAKSFPEKNFSPNFKLSSNFTRENYLNSIEKIREFIRAGQTYQTNLTQQLKLKFSEKISAEQVFLNLRKNHPAPFSAFLRRKNDTVISASPERFFKVYREEEPEKRVFNETEKNPSLETAAQNSKISVSPIKGTRPRGQTPAEDSRLKKALLNSEKDRAENVMIVDLLRNDIGRICEFGSVRVEKLCDLEEHPSLFHLVSTISGNLCPRISFSDIIRAVFPCGSITGAPKIRTMRIIEEIETASRGLSMGAVGFVDFNKDMDFSVAIRTAVLRDNEAVFNVGGGITIDSDAAEEYAETLTKATALLEAFNAKS